MSNSPIDVSATRLPDQPLGMTNTLSFKLTVTIDPGSWKIDASANCYGRLVGSVSVDASGPADVDVAVPCDFTINEAIPTGVECVVSVTPA